MNISYNWLKDLVEIDLSPQETAEKLTSVGLAVEGIHPNGDDFVLDVDLTSNRGDALSHLGTARELAAIQNAKLKVANSTNNEQRTTNENLVTIEDPDLCHRFTARIIRNVRIGASPDWLIKRLEAIGQRSVNNVADITNYVMLELGNPMHAFDLNKLAENRIVVRRAKAGETMKTLDEVERKFGTEMLLICDAEKPVAVGGVMGGEFSGISEETTDVLLEVAYFKRESIRRTSRALGLTTEAAYRFERGVDVENLIRASNRATELICEIAGGEAGEFVDVYPNPQPLVEIPFRASRVKELTGVEVAPEKMLQILTALGFKMRENPEAESITFVAPTWRHDVSIEEDLVEEIARHAGYDQIAEELPPAFGAGEYQPTEPQKKALRQTLTSSGFNEAISYSFIDAKHDETFELLPGLIDEFATEKFVTLRDSIIEGAVRMRPTLLPGLLDALRTNLNFGERNIRLFEIGKIFAGRGGIGELPTEKEAFAIVVTGGEIHAGKAEPIRELDFYDAKGVLEAAVSVMHLPELQFRTAGAKHLREGQAAEILFGNETIGSIGKLTDSIAQEYKFRQPVFVAELDLEKLLKSTPAPILYKPLPRHPSMLRDVSLLVKRSISFGEIRAFIESLNVEHWRRVEFVDVYEGKGVADDERSLTLRFEFRADDRTLREEEAESAQAHILQAIEEKFGAKLRF
ncbi:MAG: phenylalanine--tRNA ligase subunit beta [Acidobacteriota bacterium]|nr:phenylalanine--tRNA ligase subunit beta [Acidobacteriota bacterium]